MLLKNYTLLPFFLCLVSVHAQTLSSLDRQCGDIMLSSIKKDLREHYYDTTYHGMNIDNRFASAIEGIDSARTVDGMYLVIAQTLLDLDEAHTAFIPPRQPDRIGSGFEMEMIGDSCFVTSVVPGSGAEAAGIIAGTRILGIEGEAPSRQSIHRLNYLVDELGAQRIIHLTIGTGDLPGRPVAFPVVQSRSVKSSGTAGRMSGFESLSRVRNVDAGPAVRKHKIRSVGTDIAIWKLPAFDLSWKTMQNVMHSILKKKNLIIDLRGNQGGYIRTLVCLAGFFFDRDVLLCMMHGREGIDSLTASPQEEQFRGNVSVLIDSKSTSSSEVFAKAIQLYKRGTVFGDVSGGMVMKAEYFQRSIGIRRSVTYGSNITTAAVTMPDGSRLQNVGVHPDILVLPTFADLQQGVDPVLARAINFAGFAIGPREAAGLFSANSVR